MKKELINFGWNYRWVSSVMAERITLSFCYIGWCVSIAVYLLIAAARGNFTALPSSVLTCRHDHHGTARKTGSFF